MKAKLRSLKLRWIDGRAWQKLNPFYWTCAEIKLFLAFFMVFMLPVFFFIGFQPAPVADAASYPQLEIASINLKTPVATLAITDHQLIAPATIAGVYQDVENKTFIIGHSSTVFKKLKNVEVGETIIYNEQKYIVSELQTLIKADIDMRKILQAEEQETMIIMTCAGDPLPNQDATHRLIITAYLAEE